MKELERELHRKDKALTGKPPPSAAVKSDGESSRGITGAPVPLSFCDQRAVL